ncbi:MAG TPA: pitrilysin family protein [Nitrospirales bacterium]|nr:pitrilysin family protein [Nitrospirales bacterium]
MFRKLVLENGVRVVAERMPALKSVTVGIWVNVGSRDEGPGEEGLSHFLEHMFFKGTSRRTATDISRTIDALGGELNAFTTRESTTFYVKVLDQHVAAAIDLLADLFHHSRFDQKEIEKEKQVVLEEIRMVQDDPEDLVQDLHAEQVLAGHPLGRSILGEPATIQSIRRRDLVDYINRHYQPEETIIAIAGNFDHRDVLPLLRKAFGSFHRRAARHADRRPPTISGGVQARRKPLEQAHLCVGLPGIAADRKERYAAHALNAILGGSVSSRLFQVIREDAGLAYSVYSYLSTYSDCGTLTVFSATRPREAGRVLRLIRRELTRMRSHGLTRAELARAKRHLKGSIMLSLDSTSSRMNKLAKDELFEGRHVPLDEVLARIDDVRSDRVIELARQLIDFDRIGITGLGPVSRGSLEAAFG